MILKVFEMGEYPQGSWPIERVKRMADAYDPENNVEAAGVVGHMDNVLAERIENELAHCWVKSLSMTETGEVFADIPNEDISPQLRQWLLDKNLRYISSEIAEFDKKDEKVPPYLVRIAFLGRSIPAVPTTKVPALFRRVMETIGIGKFAAPENESGASVVRFCRKLDPVAINELRKATQGASSEITSHNQAADPGSRPVEFQSKEGSMGEKELQDENTRLKAENAALSGRLTAFETKDRETKEVAAKQDAEAFFGKLRDDGMITPAQFEKAVAVDIGMTEDSRKDYRSLFSKEGRKPVAGLGAGHFASAETAQGERPLNGSLVGEIRSFAKEQKISFEEASRRLHKERPELFGEEA